MVRNKHDCGGQDGTLISSAGLSGSTREPRLFLHPCQRHQPPVRLRLRLDEMAVSPVEGTAKRVPMPSSSHASRLLPCLHTAFASGPPSAHIWNIYLVRQIAFNELSCSVVSSEVAERSGGE